MLLTTPHTRPLPYRLWLLSLLLLPGAASALDRDGVLAEAARYAEHTWQMKAENQKASCKADYKSDYSHRMGIQGHRARLPVSTTEASQGQGAPREPGDVHDQHARRQHRRFT